MDILSLLQNGISCSYLSGVFLSIIGLVLIPLGNRRKGHTRDLTIKLRRIDMFHRHRILTKALVLRFLFMNGRHYHNLNFIPMSLAQL